MQKKCGYCGNPLDESQSVCSVCKIDSAADKNLLALAKKEEKKVNYYRRALNTIAALTILGGVFGIIRALPPFFETPWDFNVPFQVFGIVIDVLYLAYGISLMNHKRVCYITGIIIYSLSILLGLISLNAVVVIANILFLSYVASPTSKKILQKDWGSVSKKTIRMIATFVILLSVLAFLMSVRGQQLSEGKAKAVKVAIGQAHSLGYQVDKMEVGTQKLALANELLAVTFKSNPKSAISDLIIVLRYEDVYDEVKILGTYKNIDFNKGQEMITSDLTQEMANEISQALSGK